jgi:ketosteroid isomerase-like protein
MLHRTPGELLGSMGPMLRYADTGDMMIDTGASSTQQMDRLAIRDLVDAYARCADRRDADGQKALFTEDTRFVVYMDGQGSPPSQVLNGREALTPVFDDLNRYQATMHFNGQSTVTLGGDRATGESYCIAHHLSTTDGERTLMLAYLRYHDTFTKEGGDWLFAERILYVDWTETRPSAA